MFTLNLLLDLPMQGRDELKNPYWIEQSSLRNGTKEYLSEEEITFWKDLIEKYLSPIESNEEHKKRVNVIFSSQGLRFICLYNNTFSIVLFF